MGQVFAGVNFEEYLRHVPTIVSPVSILSGMIKCGTFALISATVCTFKGYTTSGGAKGVGRAVVSTAVSTMICIVGDGLAHQLYWRYCSTNGSRISRMIALLAETI